MTVTVARTLSEGLKQLREVGTKLDLIVLHREGVRGVGDPGMMFLEQLKSDSSLSEIPLILTTEKWDDAQCAFHQNTAFGANAYLRYPCEDGQILSAAEQILGLNWSTSAPTPVSTSPSAPAPGPVEKTATFSNVVLEDATSIHSEHAVGPGAIQLDAPEKTIPSISVSRPTSGNEIELELDAPALPPNDSLATDSLEAFSEAAPSDENFSADSDSDVDNSVEPSPPVEKGAPPERDVLQDMPYLLSTPLSPSAKRAPPVHKRAETFIPGGVSQAPDMDTLKKFLMLREQDVEMLSAQLEALREHVTKAEEALTFERARSSELTHMVEEHDSTVARLKKDHEASVESLRQETEDLRFKLKVKADKAKVLEGKVREAAGDIEKLRERVRLDIRKIRNREKELENRLEILRKDSEVLIDAREKKIIELKRKIDLIEFNMDLLQDRYMKEQQLTAELQERLNKAAQAMRVAGGLLGESPDVGSEFTEVIGTHDQKVS